MSSFFFCTDPATTPIYTLSLHDALPISCKAPKPLEIAFRCRASTTGTTPRQNLQSRNSTFGSPTNIARIGRENGAYLRSEEHTSELQSPYDLVCRLLLEKKKQRIKELST